MINFSKYDFNKIKPEDKLIFIQGEQMNQMEWQHKISLWQKILNPFYSAPMPKKYYVKASQNLNKTKPKFPEHMEHRCRDKDCKICKEFSS